MASIWKPASKIRLSASWFSSGRRQKARRSWWASLTGCESAHSWRDLLLDLKRRGLWLRPRSLWRMAFGFWKALGEVWPTTREQRCWVQKTANVLNRLPKSLHAKAKSALQDIWMAGKEDAIVAFDAFRNLPHRIQEAVDCLTKDRDALLAFYDFRQLEALATTNPMKVHLRPCGTEPSVPRDACRTRPPWPWSSSWLRAPRKLAPLDGPTSCQS